MEITGYKKITDKKWLNLFDVEYSDKNNQSSVWEVVSRKAHPKCITNAFDPPDAVVIVPFHKVEKKLEDGRGTMRGPKRRRLINEMCAIDEEINRQAMLRFGMWIR